MDARAAIFLLLLGVGDPASVPEATEPSGRLEQAPAAQHRGLQPEMLRGVWHGSPVGGGELLEVTFSDDVRPATVVAHFMVAGDGASQTVRRVGRLAGDSVRFTLVDGGQIVLTLVGDNRLVGGLVARRGQGPGSGASLELSRLHPR